MHLYLSNLYALTTLNGEGGWLSESNHTHVYSLVEQLPLLSDTLHLLRLPLEQHVKQVLDTFEDLFQYVLALPWEEVGG